VTQPHALRASGEPDTGEVDDDPVLGEDDAGAAHEAGPFYCRAGAQAHLAADPPAPARTMAQPHALTSTLLVLRWLVKIKVVPGATGCPEWLEAAAKLLQARNVSFSGGGASKAFGAFPESSDCEPYDASATTDTASVQQLVQDKAERSDESHGESTEPEWLAIAAEIPYASSDSSSDGAFEAYYYELDATAQPGEVQDEAEPDAPSDEVEVEGEQDEAETAVRSDAVGGGPDALPDELAQSAAGFVVCLGVAALAIMFSTLAMVFSTLASFGMVDLDCDAHAAEELSTFFSFQTAVDALEVADAVRPATSANAGLTLATARTPGLCNSLC